MRSGNVMRSDSSMQGYASGGSRSTTNLADILERVLDKGIVIAGDIQVNLLDIELLTIKLRLVIASLDTARQVGINWWEADPWLNADALRRQAGAAQPGARWIRPTTLRRRTAGCGHASGSWSPEPNDLTTASPTMTDGEPPRASGSASGSTPSPSTAPTRRRRPGWASPGRRCGSPPPAA